jgi:hypothetical protein
MILGRTPEGAIKIKKDDPLGLRAVNCACCNSCGCFEISIPIELRETFENATSGTVWGYNSNDFGLNPAPDVFWFMDWFFPAPEGAAYQIFVETSFRKNGCLYFRGEYLPLDDNGGLALYGNPAGCLPETTTYAEGTFTINGEGAFSYYYIVQEAGIPYSIPPVPNLVIT